MAPLSFQLATCVTVQSCASFCRISGWLLFCRSLFLVDCTHYTSPASFVCLLFWPLPTLKFILSSSYAKTHHKQTLQLLHLSNLPLWLFESLVQLFEFVALAPPNGSQQLLTFSNSTSCNVCHFVFVINSSFLSWLNCVQVISSNHKFSKLNYYSCSC